MSFAQQKMSCCAASATESFAQLASSKEFVLSHPLPLPFTFTSENGNAITFKAPDGTDAYGWEIKAKQPTNNYLFVIHEYWGLNDYIKKESETLWNDLGNVNVIALDLYDKKIATTREDAGKFMQAVTTERASAIINGAINYAGANAKIYTIGWCFGGGWSLQATLLAGKQAYGCVMYYGMPEKDTNEEQLQYVHDIFNQLGKAVKIDEKLMNAATVLGACGTAFAMRYIRANIQGGIEIGFDAATANLIAAQTVKGAAELLLKKGTHPEHEIDKVTTPKGCTIAGLNEMEHQGFSSSLIKGLVASYNKIGKD